MSNEEKPQQEGMLQIEISPEVAQGTYANLAMIAHSTSEVIIDFVCRCVGPGILRRINGAITQ